MKATDLKKVGQTSKISKSARKKTPGVVEPGVFYINRR
jgi:hypothetical protein